MIRMLVTVFRSSLTLNRLCPVVALLAYLSVVARAAEPQITAVTPLGGRQGTAFQAEMFGKHLGQARKLWTDCDSITGTITEVSPTPRSNAGDPKKTEDEYRVVVQVVVNPAARPGPHTIRLITPLGISNPFSLQIVAEPVVPERPSGSNAVDSPQLLKSPVVVNGRIGEPGEVDSYAIDVAKGQRLLFEVITGSGLFTSSYTQPLAPPIAPDRFREPTVEVYQVTGSWFDPERKDPLPCDDHSVYFQFPHLSYSSHYLPRRTCRFKKSGRFRIDVGAAEGQGGPDFNYQLRILPADASEPLNWSPRRLAHSANPDWQERTFTRRVSNDWLRQVQLRSGLPTLLPECPAETKAASGQPLEAQDSVLETQPNGRTSPVSTITTPVVVNGTVASPGDVSVYRFRVEPGQKLAFEIETPNVSVPYFAPRLDVFDSDGKELFNNLYRKIDGDGDDWIKSLEPKTLYTFEKGGEYRLELRDLTFRNGSPQFTYRVLIRTQFPHVGRIAPKIFRVLGSSSEVEEDKINLPAGEVRKLVFIAEREEGFKGELALGVENLPPGVQAHAGSSFDLAAFETNGEVIEGRYESRGTVHKERFRPSRRLVTLLLVADSQVSSATESQLLRFFVTPILDGKPGPRIPIYEMPLMVLAPAVSRSAQAGKE